MIKEPIDNILMSLRVNSTESHFQTELLEIRNMLLDDISLLYKKSKLNPLLRFLIQNLQKLDKTHETKLETLLNGIHSNQIINASKKVLELKYIEQKIESAKQKLQKNEDSFIFEFSKKK